MNAAEGTRFTGSLDEELASTLREIRENLVLTGAALADVRLANARDLTGHLSTGLAQANNLARIRPDAERFGISFTIADSCAALLSSALDGTIICGLERARARASAHTRASGLDVTHNSEIAFALGRFGAFLLSSGLTVALVSSLIGSRIYRKILVLAVIRISTLARSRARKRSHGGPKRLALSAVGLLTIATRILPIADRARYGEEYQAELRELTQAGTGRAGQLLYAIRQLRCAPRLRSALRSPRRKGAVP